MSFLGGFESQFQDFGNENYSEQTTSVKGKEAL